MDLSLEDQKDNYDIPPNDPENVENKECDKSKNSRHRKKQFYNSIREQMEFYFGNANLSKDRFLKKLISKDPFIQLETFLKFNKLKKLTNSIDDIARAIANSSLLELNDDKTKVRRKTEIPEERNADERTIYVESLPPHADHEWVIKVFNRYGTVTYVSLPKYKRSRKIKEFGFVEFENESSVGKVLRAFREFDGVLCSDLMDPSNLVSITSYIKEQNDEQECDSTSNANDNSITVINVEKADAETSENENNNKRKKENGGVTQAKKLKLDSEENKEESETAAETSENENEEMDAKEIKKKKIRKHRKRKNHLKIIDESDFHELKILAKKDWKRLRNKYLNMQREKVKEFKRIQNRDKLQYQKASRESNKTSFKQQTHNVNFYCTNENLDENSKNGDEEKKTNNIISTKNKNLAIEKEPLFSFEPGLIIKIKFIEPCVDIKSFKADMKQYDCVKYIDVKEGALESYIRCDNSSNAENLIGQISCAEYQCQILSGNDEQEYWKKIMHDREMKLNKQIKVKPKRGREKVLKAIAKHIRFDDDE